MRLRRQPPGLPRQAADIVMVKLIAAFERLQDQMEAAVSPDIDIVHRVHLHGCAQGHILLHQKQSVCPELVEGPYFLPQRRKKRRSEEHTSELQSLMRISY